MVSILPSARSPFDAIMQSIGQSLQQTLPGAAQQLGQRHGLQKSLESIKNLTKNPASSDLDIMLAAMQAGAGIPGSERYMAALLPELTRVAAANRSANIQQPGEQGAPQPRNREPMEAPTQHGALPDFMNQPEQTAKFFPTNIGPQGGPGNAPQAATTGQSIPVPSPSEKPQLIRKLQKDSKAAGEPLTYDQAEQKVDKYIEDVKSHNANVEKERGQRVGAQKNYGEKSVAELEKVFPNATSEQKAIFRKIGEEAATKGKSEAEIDRYLSKEATKFGNAIDNVSKDIERPGLLDRITKGAEGTYKNLEQASNDVRRHLQPILDLGLYDTARNLLSSKKYGTEEIEAIINPLSERSKIYMNQVPRISTAQKEAGVPGIGGQPFSYTPQHIENVKEGLINLKKVDPNFSLVLARKAFEDRGYDWRIFKDALNQLEQEGFKLEDDQQSQRGNLDRPPVGIVGKILHGLDLRGR